MFLNTLDALNAALAGVQGLRVDRTGFMGAEPPAVTVGPPSYAWEAYAAEPTSTSTNVVLYVPADEQAVRRLAKLLPLAVEAIEGLDDMVVTAAIPEQFNIGGSAFPAYRITVEVT